MHKSGCFLKALSSKGLAQKGKNVKAEKSQSKG